MPEGLGEVPEIDTSRPHPARMYDYYLGGNNQPPGDVKPQLTAIGKRHPLS
jgi:hypothetical protein